MCTQIMRCLALLLLACLPHNVLSFCAPRVPAGKINSWVQTKPALAEANVDVLVAAEETTVPELLARYYASSATPGSTAKVIVAPNLHEIKQQTTDDLTQLLFSTCSSFQSVFSPTHAADSAAWGPHVSLHHSGTAASTGALQSAGPILTAAQAMDKVHALYICW